MSTYREFTATPMGCVVCYNPLAAQYRIFPCGCMLPLHDACIPYWKNRCGTCPLCESTWTPHTAMSHPLPLFSSSCTIRCCTAIVLLLVLVIIALILYYFIALR